MLRLSEVIREYRWAKRIAVKDIAAAIGVSSATINRIENGDMPSGQTLSRILRWLLEEVK